MKPNLRDISYLKKRWPDRIILASIMGFSNDEWAELAKACDGAGADMLELNFSCPHMAVEGSGCKVGQEHELVEKFTATVRKVTRLPLVAKMTPNLADMSVPALAAKAGGADAICAINTVKGISEIGLDDWVPKPNVFGKGAISGYSGPAIKPIGLRFIAELAMDKRLGLPLSGVGGIETWIDCPAILAGASTVQVTTGVIHYGYRIVEDDRRPFRLHDGPRHRKRRRSRGQGSQPRARHRQIRRQAPGLCPLRPGALRGLRPVLHRVPGRGRLRPGMGRSQAPAQPGA